VCQWNSFGTFERLALSDALMVPMVTLSMKYQLCGCMGYGRFLVLKMNIAHFALGACRIIGS